MTPSVGEKKQNKTVYSSFSRDLLCEQRSGVLLMRSALLLSSFRAVLARGLLASANAYATRHML